MRISFFGAAQEVTGSMHLIEVNGQRVLLECGMYQGRRDESFRRNKTFPFDPKTVSTMVLSHAHIDHSGNIPNLVKQGFDGQIWCTAATRDLCSYMLQDSGHIQEQDVEYVNRKRKRGQPPVEPLYTKADAQVALRQFAGIGLHRCTTDRRRRRPDASSMPGTSSARRAWPWISQNVAPASTGGWFSAATSAARTRRSSAIPSRWGPPTSSSWKAPTATALHGAYGDAERQAAGSGAQPLRAGTAR